jgi:hypothetical protein
MWKLRPPRPGAELAGCGWRLYDGLSSTSKGGDHVKVKTNVKAGPDTWAIG